MNKLEIHKTICDQLHGMYAEKNADYGDSFSKTRAKYGDAILIRLTDKLNRLEELLLSGRTPCVVNESIDDTLADLANYCILELVERRADEQAAAALAALHNVPPIENSELTNCITITVPRPIKEAALNG